MEFLTHCSLKTSTIIKFDPLERFTMIPTREEVSIDWNSFFSPH